MALGYTYDDAFGYAQGQPNFGPLKLGRFVKAAALISPVTNVVGLKPTTVQVMKMPEVCRDLFVMIVVGNKNIERFAEANRLYNLFVNARPPNIAGLITVYFFKTIDTPLQGFDLLAHPGLKVREKIVAFLKIRLVKIPTPGNGTGES